MQVGARAAAFASAQLSLRGDVHCGFSTTTHSCKCRTRRRHHIYTVLPQANKPRTAETGVQWVMEWLKTNLVYAQQQAQEAAVKAREVAEQARTKAATLAGPAYEKAKELARATTERAQDKLDQLQILPPKRTQVAPSAEELQQYCVTPELKEHLGTLTYSTFSDYKQDNLPSIETLTTKSGDDFRLTPWQERHATLVLREVPHLHDLRFVLCPRRMTEAEFWTIYFLITRKYVKPDTVSNANTARTAGSPLPPPVEMPKAISDAGRLNAIAGTASDNVAGPAGSSPAVEDNDDLDEYLKEALKVDKDGGDSLSELSSDVEDLDDYLNQLDADLQDEDGNNG